MALRPRISHVMTRDGFIWKDKRAGVCVSAEMIRSLPLGRGVVAKKVSTQVRMVPLFF